MNTVVALLSDFGSHDWYVAAMKARILERAPGARLVDVCHEVPAFAVTSAAFVLAQVWWLLPPRTVFLVVVDPGVGSPRRAVAVEAEDRFLVGPDNGVFARVLLDRPFRAVTIDPGRLRPGARVSATFHGRDVFAPAAGALAAGEPLDAIGSAIDDLAPGPGPSWGWRGQAIVATIVWVDRFGNCVTEVPADVAERLGPAPRVRARGLAVEGVATTFGDVEPGAPLAYVGSGATLEVGVREGNAAESFDLRIGSTVEIRSTRSGGDGT